MKFDVIGFGALNLDKLFKVNMIAKEEEEAFVTHFTECAGGSAANTIVGLSRLELETGFIGKVASDREGKFLLNELRKEKVNTDGITVSESNRSGTVMGYINPEGDRALYVDPGVNNQLDFHEIKLDYVSCTDFLHLTSFVGDNPFETQKQLIDKISDVNICFDPGSLYAQRGMKQIKPIIKKSYAIFPNEIETKLLTGYDYMAGAKTFIDLGAKLVAVKLGNRGCYVTDGRERQLIDAYYVDAVDTTGAGDAFCAGFIYGLVKGKDIIECGQLGNFVASRCVLAIGARAGLPRLSDLKESRIAS